MDDFSDGPAILGQIAREQARASDPAASAWVSANAGSGKTHVLSQRVIRLLLEGNRPSAILCLTYTKAAAAEMANRVFDRLSEWTRLGDAELARRIEEIEGKPPGPGRLVVARQLFARALETPGGLKIQTIHAFCESVLHQFPLEANVAGHFEILDDVAANALLAEARRTLLTAASAEENEVLAAAFQYVLEAGGEFGLEKLLTALIANREPIGRFITFAERQGGVDLALRRCLGLGRDEDEDAVRTSAWPLPSLSGSVLEAYHAAASAHGKVKAADFAAGLRAAAAAETPGERWILLCKLFLKDNGEPRKLSSGAAPNAVLAAMPDAADRIDAATAHIRLCHDRLARCRTFEATRAALRLAARLGQDYERLKRQRGRLDFDDLVSRTARLLERDGAGPWVHYKLDQGIDHILVDEAQDTSPGQWAVIRALADDFFAGQGAHDKRRTLFAVGDGKQSIYSFQGAEPERFETERHSVRRRIDGAGERFEDVRLRVSFRSTGDVLGAVDHVFAVADNRRGLGGEPIVHETVRIGHPGSVEVWEMIRKEPVEEEADWTAPFDAIAETAPAARLARRVAATLKQWIGHETITGKEGVRLVRPGDILVLVRKRDGFVPALTRELKQRADIPVAGADRLKLAEHIAVMDLTALGRVMLLPEDDLSLAALLKSPLFGLSEDELYRLATERDEGQSLFQRLSRLVETGEERWRKIYERLSDWLAQVDRLPVFEFFAGVLAEGGRRRFLARLGHEASDVLDEFLSFAFEQERTGLPGMQAFLAVLETDSPEIKREMEAGGDEVRIMTVHASKGLEAPIVFLVDSGGKAVHSSHMPALRPLPPRDDAGAEPPAMLWVPGKDHENEVTEGIKARLEAAGEEEYRRLLYVGMTRAADRLVVCGYQNPQKPGYRYWQQMVWEALAGEGASAERRTYGAEGEEWQGLHFCTGKQTLPPAVPEAAVAMEEPALPEALRRAPVMPPRLPRPLAPSSASAVIDGDAPERPSGSPLFAPAGGNAVALERGRIVHRFLQVLPGLAVNERDRAARRYLARACPNWSEEEKEQLLASVFAVLGDPAFAAVFAPDSEAEVSIMGTLTLGSREHAVSGRIDRLAVTPERVFVVDYKTNRPPVLAAADVPDAYKAQLAIYRAVLAPLYPGRRIEAALLFTEAPALVQLAERDLDAALAALTPT